MRNKSMIAAVAWMGVSALIAGCGGSDGARANVDVGPMPPGGSFTGVWFSPQYGEMHLIQQSDSVVGEYKKNERFGKIQGTVTGNVLRFQWEEERQLVRGMPTVTRGRGYFRYEVGGDERHNLLGAWGIDDDETGGGPWNAYKLRNREPKLSTQVDDDVADAAPEFEPQELDEGFLSDSPAEEDF